MFEYGTSSIGFARVSLEEACARVAALGLKHIDLWFVKGMCEHLPPGQAALDMPRLRRALSNNGLACHAFSVFGSSKEVTLARMEQLAELGGKYLVRDPLTNGKEHPQDAVDRMLPFVEKAKSLNVAFAPENHADSAFDSLEQIRYVLDALPSKHLSVAYAPIHSYKRKEDPTACIREIASRIGFCYAWDWGAAAEKHWRDPSDQLPGTGDLDFSSMFRALKETGYREPLCLFAHGIEDWPAQQAEDGLRKALVFCRQAEPKAAVASA